MARAKQPVDGPVEPKVKNPPYELELLPIGGDLNRDWQVGGDWSSVDEAEAALLDRLSSTPVYERARVRQYLEHRSAAICHRTWTLDGPTILTTVNGIGFGQQWFTHKRGG